MMTIFQKKCSLHWNEYNISKIWQKSSWLTILEMKIINPTLKLINFCISNEFSLSGRQVIKSLDYARAGPSTLKCSASNLLFADLCFF